MGYQIGNGKSLLNKIGKHFKKQVNINQAKDLQKQINNVVVH